MILSATVDVLEPKEKHIEKASKETSTLPDGKPFETFNNLS